jgi:hypothetical protein
MRLISTIGLPTKDSTFQAQIKIYGFHKGLLALRSIVYAETWIG